MKRISLSLPGVLLSVLLSACAALGSTFSSEVVYVVEASGGA